MTLHSITGATSTYWWYAAVPNERRGTLHLLRVPCIRVDLDRLQAPAWMGEAGFISYRQRYEAVPIVTPAHITAEHPTYTRLCTRRQQARYWIYESDRVHTDFGICPVCLEFRNANPHQVGVPNHNRYAIPGGRAIQAIGNMYQVIEAWRASVEASLYTAR